MKKMSGFAVDIWHHGKSDDCPIIDIHGHMGNWKGIYFPHAQPVEMVKSMDRAGVKMVVFSHHAAISSPDVLNRNSIEAVNQFPDRFRAYCVINPNYPDITKRELDTYDEFKHVYAGLKFHASMHNLSYLSGGYQSAWEFADDRKLVVLVHTWSGSDTCGEDIMRKIADRYRNVRLILGHSMHNNWTAAIELASDFPNVYLDTCAVLDERSGVLERFVKEAGSHKVLFGTDIPWFSLHYYIGSVIAADITEDDMRNIFYRNAQRLLYETH